MLSQEPAIVVFSYALRALYHFRLLLFHSLSFPSHALQPMAYSTLTSVGIISILLLFSFHLSLPLLMYERVLPDDACLFAMCDTDSGCVPHGCNVDDHGRIGCGYFRLNVYQFRQCYQPGKKEDEDEILAWINCAEDYHCSAACIRTIGSRFRVKCYGKSDCETLSRIHDGGANGCRNRTTASYWMRVKEVCGDACRQPIWRRH